MNDYMSPRKNMASGAGMPSTNFGVAKFPSSGAAMHPDAMANTGSKPAMADGERGAGPGIGGTREMHPAQAAPDHGPHMPGGHVNFRREGKA